MDLQVKSTKMKQETNTLQRNEGGVSMDLRTEVHGRNWACKKIEARETSRELKEKGKKRKFEEMGLRQMGRASSFEDDRRQIGSDEKRDR